MSDEFRSKLCCIVVDEAHTIIQWGQAKKDNTPFREWFGRVGEIRSLCPDVPLLVLTATASKRNRQMISKSLSLKSAVEIIESPDRPTIKLYVKHIKSNEEVNVSLKWIFQGLKKSEKEFPKHVVFCKTILECAKVYTALRMNVPSCKVYFHMYHSCTPKDIKEEIARDMCKEDGYIRVLVCPNAAGMGVNFKNVNSVVNFGPPHDVDTFVQQIGRAGRDSDHVLICSKRQLARVNEELKEYANSIMCRRSVLMANYSELGHKHVLGHECCDICSNESVIRTYTFILPLKNLLTVIRRQILMILDF